MKNEAYNRLRASLLEDSVHDMTAEKLKGRIAEIYSFVAKNPTLDYSSTHYLLKAMDVYKVMHRAACIREKNAVQ